MSTLQMILFAMIGGCAFGLSYAHSFFTLAARGEKTISVRRKIAAGPDRVWARIVDGSAMVLPEGMTARRKHDDEEPDLIETVIDFNGRRSRRLDRIVVREQPEHYVLHTEEIDGAPDPLGAHHWEAYSLFNVRKGSVLSVTARGQFGSAIAAFKTWLRLRRSAKRLKTICAPIPVEVDMSAMQNDLKVSVLATVSFVLLWGIEYALVLVPLLVLHEYGHFLAMKLTGQPAPRMFLVPFFGGLAVANQPHKSAFDDAFVSLMGPGFSILASVGLYVAAIYVLPPPYARWAYYAAGVSGFINALNLIPALPLDGGNVLRTLSESLSPGTARYALIFLGVACGVMLVSVGYFGFAIFIGLGLMNALQMSERPRYPPLSFSSGLVILTGYVVTAAIHVAVYVQVFGWHF